MTFLNGTNFRVSGHKISEALVEIAATRKTSRKIDNQQARLHPTQSFSGHHHCRFQSLALPD
jgi:hypothetical protein